MVDKHIIESQFKVLRTYKNYNHKKALQLNRGNMTEFFKALIIYEKQLSDAQMATVDGILAHRYNINSDMDDAWYALSEELRRIE
jgi:hypothetical protein